MPNICSTCNALFDNRNHYSNHIKRCVHQVTFTLTHSRQTVTINRTEEGVFLCYCSNSGCPKSKGFATLDGLKRHINKLQSSWLGPEQKVGKYFSLVRMLTKHLDRLY
jgi:hypothetical protein